MASKRSSIILVITIISVCIVVLTAAMAGIGYWVFSQNKSGIVSKRWGASGSHNKIGVVELKGVILDSRRFIEDLDLLIEDPQVKGVVLRINSPGGAVAPSQEIYDHILTAKKSFPVYASLASVAASGGYYAAVAASKIYANPGTITGSIGVIMQFNDVSKLMDWAKISSVTVKTGKFKDVGSPARAMTAEEKELLQSMVDNVLGQFRKAVADGRGLPMEKVVEVSDGRIFSGEQAKGLNLVDELGSFEKTIKAMATDLKLGDDYRVVEYVKKKSFFEKLFGADDSDEESSNRQLGGVLALSNILKKVNILYQYSHAIGL